MTKGSVVSIQIAKDAKGTMESLQEVQAVEGRGLEGDRYCNQVGSYSHNPGPGPGGDAHRGGSARGHGAGLRHHA